MSMLEGGGDFVDGGPEHAESSNVAAGEVGQCDLVYGGPEYGGPEHAGSSNVAILRNRLLSALNKARAVCVCVYGARGLITLVKTGFLRGLREGGVSVSILTLVETGIREGGCASRTRRSQRRSLCCIGSSSCARAGSRLFSENPTQTSGKVPTAG